MDIGRRINEIHVSFRKCTTTAPELFCLSAWRRWEMEEIKLTPKIPVVSVVNSCSWSRMSRTDGKVLNYSHETPLVIRGTQEN